MSADRDMVALFRRELELCKVHAGERVGILSEDRVRLDFAEAFLAAAEELGADAVHVNIKKRPGSYFGPGNSLKGHGAAIEALKKSNIVIDLMGLLWSNEQIEITDAGARMLLVIERIEVLRRMMSSPETRRRVESGIAMLGKAKELRITGPSGTDVTYKLGKYRASGQYGFTDQPGRWDAWPGAFVYSAAHDDGVDGKVVVNVGDMLLPFMRYVTQPITLRIAAGKVVEIEGTGLDAEIMREYIRKWNDPRAYAISHIGWGLDENARWDFIATDPLASGSTGQDGRAFYGNVLFSTGPNIELGGTNDTPSHLDIPLRGCSLFLDGKPVVRNGDIVPADLRAAGR